MAFRIAGLSRFMAVLLGALAIAAPASAQGDTMTAAAKEAARNANRDSDRAQDASAPVEEAPETAKD